MGMNIRIECENDKEIIGEMGKDELSLLGYGNIEMPSFIQIIS
jgi:hypothetical protein